MRDLELDPIERALSEIASGRPVVVMDDESRENEGDLVFAASLATADLLAFTVRYTSGVVCTPMEGELLDQLALPQMTDANNEAMRTAFTISVDAAQGVTTGISAADRTATVRLLADPACRAADLVRPGHVFPLRYQPGGVLVRPGHTEAAVDLLRLAGLPRVGVIAELVHDDGTMRRGRQLRAFADEHGLALVSIADLVTHRRRQPGEVERVVTARLPTSVGDFTVVGYRDHDAGREHLALVHGDIGDGADVLTRMHSECLTGDVFGSRRCDCGQQLRDAMAAVVARGRGIVVYLRGHEGRGIGLLDKLRAYTLQDRGLDTVEANLELGLPADARDYAAGASILADLGVHSVDLITNNPAKENALRGFGIRVSRRIAVPVEIHDENRRYLATKRDRMGHTLETDLGQALDVVLGSIVSGAGQPSLEPLDGTGLRVAIAAGRWHEEVMNGLIAGARRALEDSQIDSPTVVRVAGCFELPVVVRSLVGREFDAVVALGVVVRGGTPHFDYVCRAVTDGLSRVALDSGIPVGFGILTCDDDEQALDRSGLPGSREDKGYEAAHAALETALTLRRLRSRDG